MRDLPKKSFVPWFRVGGVAVAALVLVFVFRRIDLRDLGHALRSARPGWFLAAVALYGAGFLPGAWRWHLMLRMTGCAVHPGATTRMSLIGHFFYTLFFGMAGGDLAKSALYARWYQMPLPEILAAAPLDRLLGLGGLMAFVVLAFGLASANGAFVHLGPATLPVPWWWIVVAGMVVLLVGAGLLRWARDSAVGKTLGAFLSAGRRLFISWPVAWQGLVCGLLVQLAFAGNLALSLQAVSHAPLPWAQLAWTFPVISVVSAIPFNVAGLGLREGAAMALLGLYGVSPADAVAASLLTLAARLFWAVLGGILLWQERRGQGLQRRVPQTISVVMPVFNEAGALEETIQRVRAVPEVCEIIIVDGGSRDETREAAARLGCRVLASPPGRGRQMRLGAAQAQGDVVLLLHADTWVPPEAGRAVFACLRDARVVGGGFWKTFREGSPLLIGSRFKCAIRLYLGRRILGDQAFFIRREVLEAIGGVPDLPLMEEFELSSRLREQGRLALADATVATSARRFNKRGVIRTYLLMWVVTWRYRLGASPEELRRLYDGDKSDAGRERVVSRPG
jgi:rSAM/selenodomain-associated transferase 2